jgi:hypothetical protein
MAGDDAAALWPSGAWIGCDGLAGPADRRAATPLTAARRACWVSRRAADGATAEEVEPRNLKRPRLRDLFEWAILGSNQ